MIEACVAFNKFLLLLRFRLFFLLFRSFQFASNVVFGLESLTWSYCSVQDFKTWFLKFPDRPVSSVVKDMTIGAGGLGFDSRVAQIGHSIDGGSPPLRRFFGAVLPRR